MLGGWREPWSQVEDFKTEGRKELRIEGAGHLQQVSQERIRVQRPWGAIRGCPPPGSFLLLEEQTLIFQDKIRTCHLLVAGLWRVAGL